MTDLSATLKVEINCPKCGRKTEKSLAQLKPNAEFQCLCGSTIRVEGSGFQTAGKSLDDLQRTISRLGKK